MDLDFVGNRRSIASRAVAKSTRNRARVFPGQYDDFVYFGFSRQSHDKSAAQFRAAKGDIASHAEVARIVPRAEGIVLRGEEDAVLYIKAF